MKEFWNNRYQTETFVYGETPNDFLKEHSHLIPKGKVLCLAEGEGRNAVFLAKNGYDVTAIDQSETGLAKAELLAKKHGVSITIICTDLADFTFEEDTWSAIVSIWAHVPPFLRKCLHSQLYPSLIPGGILILEAYTKDQLNMPGIGGPPAEQADLFMSKYDLVDEICPLQCLRAEEVHRNIQEGTGHQGESAVVQILAKKVYKPNCI